MFVSHTHNSSCWLYVWVEILYLCLVNLFTETNFMQTSFRFLAVVFFGFLTFKLTTNHKVNKMTRVGFDLAAPETIED